MDSTDQNTSLDIFLTWKVSALREYLTRRGLTKDGTKSELAALCYSSSILKLPLVPSTLEIIENNKLDYENLLKINSEILPDPLQIHDNWLDEKNGIIKFPPVYISDIIKYLTEKATSVQVKEILQDYKIGKAYEYFQNGFLQQFFYHDINSRSKYCFLRAKCVPSQKINKDEHDIWVCVDKTNGEIGSSYCTCTAGLGGTCNHVAGLLFRVEAANKLGLSACTSLPCTWKVPSRMKGVKPSKIKNLKIIKSRHGQSERPMIFTSFYASNVINICKDKQWQQYHVSKDGDIIILTADIKQRVLYWFTKNGFFSLALDGNKTVVNLSKKFRNGLAYKGFLLKDIGFIVYDGQIIFAEADWGLMKFDVKTNRKLLNLKHSTKKTDIPINSALGIDIYDNEVCLYWIGPGLEQISRYLINSNINEVFVQRFDILKMVPVAVHHEHYPRGQWPLAVVTDVLKSKDGLVRTVKLRTKSTVATVAKKHRKSDFELNKGFVELLRPVTKKYFFSIDENNRSIETLLFLSCHQTYYYIDCHSCIISVKNTGCGQR